MISELLEVQQIEKLNGYMNEHAGLTSTWSVNEEENNRRAATDRLEFEDEDHCRYSIVFTTSNTIVFSRIKGEANSEKEEIIFQQFLSFFRQESIHVFLLNGETILANTDLSCFEEKKFQAIVPTTEKATHIYEMLTELYSCRLGFYHDLTIGKTKRNPYKLNCFFEERMIVVMVTGTRDAYSQEEMVYRTLSTLEEAAEFKQEILKENAEFDELEQEMLTLIQDTDEDATFKEESGDVHVFNRNIPLVMKKQYISGQGIQYQVEEFSLYRNSKDPYTDLETAKIFLRDSIIRFLKKNRLHYITSGEVGNEAPF